MLGSHCPVSEHTLAQCDRAQLTELSMEACLRTDFWTILITALLFYLVSSTDWIIPTSKGIAVCCATFQSVIHGPSLFPVWNYSQKTQRAQITWDDVVFVSSSSYLTLPKPFFRIVQAFEIRSLPREPWMENCNFNRLWMY